MDKVINKQVIVITGASSGYGKEAARLFVADGSYETIIVARNKENLDKAALEIGGCDTFSADVTSANDWLALREYVIKKYGHIDILINNAGGGVVIKELTQQSVEQIQASLDLNLKSNILGAWTFANEMKERKTGTIINVASVCAKLAWAGFSVYSAAKAGLVLFTKCLHVELQPYNIRCTCFIPAAGRTNFRVNAGISPDEPGGTCGFEAADAGRAIYDICKMPQHVIVQEYIMWGMDQVMDIL